MIYPEEECGCGLPECGYCHKVIIFSDSELLPLEEFAIQWQKENLIFSSSDGHFVVSDQKKTS